MLTTSDRCRSWSRPAALLFLLFLACLSLLASAREWQHLWAGPHVVAGKTVQRLLAPEPPLAGHPGVPGMAAPAGSPCPVDPPTPVVGLKVRVPVAVASGQEIEYRIVVENSSRAEAHHVTVRNPLPANARFVRANPEPTVRGPELVWQLGTLPPCACREIVLVLVPAGPGDVQNCARVQFEHGQCVSTQVTPLAAVAPPPPAGEARVQGSLRVAKIGPAQAGLNEVLTYRLIVSNAGSATVAEVTLIDKLPDGLEHASGKSTLLWALGRLAPGQSRQIDYQATARKAGRLCNRVAVSASGGLYDDAESCVVVGPVAAAPAGPALELRKTGPEQRFVGRPATYQITISNPGPQPASNVVITDYLPPQAMLLSASDNGRLAGNLVQWQIGNLPPGARRTVQLAIQAQAAGELVNRATASADGSATAQAQARTLFEGATGLTFDIEVKDNPVEVGTPTTYSVTVLNQGMVPATRVQIAVNLPEQMEFQSAKGPTNFQRQGQGVVFEPLPALAPRGEVRFEIAVKAQKPGEVKCRAELRADQLGDRPVLREQSTTIYADVPGTRLLQPRQE